MNITGIELVDDLIYKHLHRSYMNDVNASLQCGIFEFDCKNVLKRFIKCMSELDLIIIEDNSKCLRTIMDTLSNLDKFEKKIYDNGHIGYNIPFNLPYKRGNKTYGTPVYFHFLLISGIDRLIMNGINHIFGS